MESAKVASEVVHSNAQDGSRLSTSPTSDIGAHPRLANATFVILARNSDLEGVVNSIQEIEQRFNARFHYPYALLNDKEFTADFRSCVSCQ